MANRERLIVALVVVFGGLMVCGCQTYPYSKVENAVYKRMEKLSRQIPKGFTEEDARTRNGLQFYTYGDRANKENSRRGKVIYIEYVPTEYIPSMGDTVRAKCANLNDLKSRTISFIRLPDSYLGFEARRSRKDQDDGEVYVLQRGDDGVVYHRAGGGAIWKRSEVYDVNGLLTIGDTRYWKKYISRGKDVPADGARRYIDLANRLRKTYSVRAGPSLAEFVGAIEAGNLDRMKVMLAKNPKLVSESDPWGNTPLHLAVNLRNKDMCELLIAKGANVNAKDKTTRMTPLHAAALLDNKDICEILIANGAKLDATSDHGQTALHLVARANRIDIAKLLIAKGANVNAKSSGYSYEDEWTPLHFACYHGRVKAVEFLIAAGADVNAKSKHAGTPLDIAVKAGHKEVAELLRKHGAVE